MSEGRPAHDRAARPLDPARRTAHGGDLDDARALFTGAPEPWIDLSTGINPVPYPHPPLDASLFRRLPSAADGAALRAAAARAYGAPDPACVVPAPGTQILIETLPRLRPPGTVAVVGPTYAEHAAAWARAGHGVVEVAEPEADAAAVVLVNPNNPDGRRWPAARLAALAEALHGRGGLLVVDEAFADLDPGESLCGRLAPGLAVLRSFGKAYGLAGLRLGFALAEPGLAARLAAALGPWAVSGPALAIGRAALDDRAWREAAAAARAADGARLDRLAAAADGVLVGGTALFRTHAFADAARVFARLGRAGVYVRRFPGRDILRFGLPADESGWERLAAALEPD